MACSQRSQVTQFAVFRIGINLGLFRILVDSKEPLSTDQLAEKTGAAPQLLTRLLRFLASVSVITEASPGHFTPSSLCGLLASPLGEALMVHAFSTVSPTMLALPSFLESSDHQDITSGTNTPFQVAFKTDLSAFAYLATHPTQRVALQTVMTADQSSQWVEGFEQFRREAQAVASDAGSGAPFFVDVGGGHGHQCVQLLDKYPALKGKLVLEDLPETVEKLDAIDGVRTVAQDFFKEQREKGEITGTGMIPCLPPDHRRQVLLPSPRPARLAG